MHFARIDRYYERSDCGVYTVAAYGPEPWKFGAWRLHPNHERAPALLGIYRRAHSARQRCTRDAQSREANMDDFDLSSGGETWCDRGDGCCKHCGEKLDAHAAKSHWCPLPLFVLDEGEPQPTEPQDAAA